MDSASTAALKIRALATDYDGTLAHHGAVSERTLSSLRRLKAAGCPLILVSGRELNDLRAIFPAFSMFDLAVLENGGLLFNPATGEGRALAAPPPSEFIARLHAAKLPLSVGYCIVATWEPHEATVLQTIKDLGLELQVIFNKGAVMVLPSGVNKATGLQIAAQQLGLQLSEIAGIGDAENDHAFLAVCGLSAAVSNALPAIKEKVHFVTQADHGDGVTELIDRMLGKYQESRAQDTNRTKEKV